MGALPIFNKVTARKKVKQITFSALSIVILSFSSCDAWKDDLKLNDDNTDKKLSELVVMNQDISIFTKVLKITGYDELLSGEQNLTVFAPTDNELKDLDLSKVDSLKKWVQNYIAYMSYYKNADGNFSTGSDTVTTITMLNSKSVTIKTSDIIKANIVGSNGVLHIINYTVSDRKNILEYLYEQHGYEQVEFIRSMDEQVMDSSRSVQTGVNSEGKPVFDTVWTSRNTFLEAYPLDNEKRMYTVVLLDNSVFDAIKQKYAKYMYQKDTKAMTLEIMKQLTSDLVLKHINIKESGRYSSVSEVLVDIDPTNILETYQASNGIVYKLSAANIRMYENKIKTQFIEGENYTDRYDGQDAWTTRYRSWASGGKDVMLKGRTKNAFSWTIHVSPTKDSTVIATKTFIYTGDTYVQSKTTNSYIQYNPKMFSCDYEIYWVSYDDVVGHSYTTPTGINFPMFLEQKLLISFPGATVLKRETDGKISNNFSPYSTMAVTTLAGVLAEKKLVRYRLNADNNTSGSTYEHLYLLDAVSDGTDAYGSGSVLKCPAYGKATFFVANTTRYTAADAGLIFLDYIRLVPKVDIND